jgi:hypothetical protein
MVPYLTAGGGTRRTESRPPVQAAAAEADWRRRGSRRMRGRGPGSSEREGEREGGRGMRLTHG